MGSALLGVVLDPSILIAAERRRMTPDHAIESVQKRTGEVPIALCSLTVGEIGHGIYRADTPETRARSRKFLDELKATVPIYPVTEATAEIVARISGEQAAKGISLLLLISSSEPAHWSLGMQSPPTTCGTVTAFRD